MSDSHTLVAFGEAIKALEGGKVAGYLVRFSTEDDPDLSGEYFTAKTYFGPSDGNNVDVLFHHGLMLVEGTEHLADHIFKPIKTKKDEIGIWAEAILDISDKYEKMVYELAQKGKLGWSSGAAKHMVRKNKNGEITRWPIAEGSLTPIPAEPRNKIMSIKSLEAEFDKFSGLKSGLDGCDTIRDVEKVLRDEVGFSNSVATLLVAKMRKLAQGDLEEGARKDAEAKSLRDLCGVLSEITRTYQSRIT